MEAATVVVALAVVVVTAENGAADVAAEERGSSGLLRPRSTLHPLTSLVGLCHLALGWVDSNFRWVCKVCRACRACRDYKEYRERVWWPLSCPQQSWGSR